MYAILQTRCLAAILIGCALIGIAQAKEQTDPCLKSMIVVSGPLQVDTDGAPGSYMPGDHGYSYLGDAMYLSRNGTWVGCADSQWFDLCRKDWIAAQDQDFKKGSAEFCTFALDPVPVQAGGHITKCPNGSGVIGNGKGKPRLGPPIEAAGGALVAPYVSTTSLMQIVDGQPVYLDSAKFPGIVAAKGQSCLLGAIAWVQYENRGVFAVLYDQGPSNLEGSIALHQLLLRGEIGPPQPVGPIPLDQNCRTAQSAPEAPFQLRPDPCTPGKNVNAASDIRATKVPAAKVTIIILPRVMVPMKKPFILENVTEDLLRQEAENKGYTPLKLAQIASVGH